ncbi:YdeI/OmpD-associated family protein, partial [Proteiniphilum sp.]|uniref:YdeI/OmpD-associated family protein n=1 Tax=Proteiniphilum sp. TaxID=1926877 RepID=UPI002B1FF165
NEMRTIMKTDVPELLFPSRSDFRTWLTENAKKSDGVWLVFGKTKEVVTLTANDALEEALCFGWIDGQMKSIGNTKYLKYFSRRKEKSIWSDKNKKTAEMLLKKGLMTELGEKAVETAKAKGLWDAPKHDAITDEQVEEFAEKLAGISPAYENFNNMSRSIRFTYTKRYLSFKSEEARQRDFEKIVDRLNKNLKPM